MSTVSDASHKIWIQRFTYRADVFSEPAMSFDAHQMKVHTVCKSGLKIQNVSTVQAGETEQDEIELVDALHLKGYYYSGTGNGFIGPQMLAKHNFSGDQANGAIAEDIQSADLNVLHKPTERDFFSNCVSRKSVTMEVEM